MKIQNVPELDAKEGPLELVAWLAAEGERVEVGQDIAELGSAKASVTISAEAAGFLHRLAFPGSSLLPGAPLAEFRDNPPTGARLSRAARESGEASAGAGLVTARTGHEDPALRRKASALISPTASLTVQLSAEPLLRRLESRGRPPAMLSSFLLAAIARAAAADRRLRSGQETVNLGFAVMAGASFRVTVIPGCEALGPEDIFRMLTLAYTRLLKNESEPQGPEAGLTVSSLMHEDILLVQPALTKRQALAVGIGGDSATPGKPLTLTATFDHRALDGKDVAAFLNAAKAGILDAS